MGPIEGEESRSRNNMRKKNLIVDSCDATMQQTDSQFSQDEGTEAEDFLDTMPVDDIYQLEDAFETQVVDPAGETQVVDLAGETQVVDLAGETQVLDDLDCMKNMPIQFLNEFDADIGAYSECEESNETDVMCETQELSQDDLLENDDINSGGVKSTLDKDPSREGSVCRGFTSIRAASIRACGLAAQARRSNCNLSTTSSDKPSPEQHTCEQDGSSHFRQASDSDMKTDKQCLENEYNDHSKKLRTSDKRKVGSAAVRQLFREDENAEIGDSDTDNETKENCLPGLSYANSQEPGELSQAHALEVVDKFLDLNFMEYEGCFGMRVDNAGKSRVVSAAKGSLDLAKSSILKSTVGDCGIYDWDDMREDDGGGDFFLKKKELFFPKGGPKQRLLTEPRKAKNHDVGYVKVVGDSLDGKERELAKDKLGDPVSSGSGLMLHKLRSKGKSLQCGEEALQKNPIRNLDEQLHMVPEPELAENGKDGDVPDMNVGPDTQMAAEAIKSLCFELHLADSKSSGPNEDVHSMAEAAGRKKLRNKTDHSEKNFASKIPCSKSVGVVTRQAKQTKRNSINTSNESSLAPKQCKKITKHRDRGLGEAEERRLAVVNVSAHHGAKSTCQRSEEEHEVEDQLGFSTPVARRTRKSTAIKRSKVAANSSDSRDEINDNIRARVCRKRTAAVNQNAETITIQKVRKVKPTGFKQSNKTCSDTSGVSNSDAVDDLQGRRSWQNASADTWHAKRLKRSREDAANIPVTPERDHLNNTATHNYPELPCLDVQSRKIVSQRTVKTRSSRNDADQCYPNHLSVTTILDDAVGASTPKQGHETTFEGAEQTGRQEAQTRCGTSSACATPANCTTPVNNVSPICMGDEYHKQSCRKNLSRFFLLKELENLVSGSPTPCVGPREPRKRKDITTIRVLFSQHLAVDIVRQQKKILAQLGGAVASSMLDATHFVADEFVRTRNMLEAIASGKPVVTRLWIESCGQASYLIDEKNYILRDARKEKEFGFCLPVSLARACQHPLLRGQKVLITPNTKPGKEILANLVKAVQGLTIERLGRSALKEDKLPNGLLILSCEEDYDICVPFLEKGGSIYSSELLLNGIVKQKLEYERHRLFGDRIKRTRSTIWLKNKSQFQPVTK